MTEPTPQAPAPQHHPQYPGYDSVPVSAPLSREEMPNGWGGDHGKR